MKKIDKDTAFAIGFYSMVGIFAILAIYYFGGVLLIAAFLYGLKLIFG